MRVVHLAVRYLHLSSASCALTFDLLTPKIGLFLDIDLWTTWIQKIGIKIGSFLYILQDIYITLYSFF